MRDAILGVWMCVRYSTPAAVFLKKLRKQCKACIARDWLTLESVWLRYEREAREAWQHFERHPHVYGDSTPEMITQFKKLEREHAKTAAQWTSKLEWLRDNDLPLDVVSYDPTGHGGGSELDADEPSRWSAVVTACAKEDRLPAVLAVGRGKADVSAQKTSRSASVRRSSRT